MGGISCAICNSNADYQQIFIIDITYDEYRKGTYIREIYDPYIRNIMFYSPFKMHSYLFLCKQHILKPPFPSKVFLYKDKKN